MSTSWFVTNALAALLLPPLSLVILGLAGWRISRRFPKTGRVTICLSIALLVVLSTEAGSRLLVKPLEARSLPVIDPVNSGAQAIVVLGGGRLYAAPEDNGHDQPSSEVLARLRHAARLQRATGLPILITGGAPDSSGESEAAVMKRSLEEDFRAKVTWIEDSSKTTAENARFSLKQLEKSQIKRILLVTDAIHMARSQETFRRVGFDVVPAATAFRSTKSPTMGDWIPTGKDLRYSHYALHEWIGLVWYRIRYGLLD